MATGNRIGAGAHRPYEYGSRSSPATGLDTFPSCATACNSTRERCFSPCADRALLLNCRPAWPRPDRPDPHCRRCAASSARPRLARHPCSGGFTCHRFSARCARPCWHHGCRPSRSPGAGSPAPRRPRPNGSRPSRRPWSAASSGASTGSGLWEVERRLELVDAEHERLRLRGRGDGLTVRDAMAGGRGHAHPGAADRARPRRTPSSPTSASGSRWPGCPGRSGAASCPDLTGTPYYPTMSWLAVDGYGFDLAYFHTDEWSTSSGAAAVPVAGRSGLLPARGRPGHRPGAVVHPRRRPRTRWRRRSAGSPADGRPTCGAGSGWRPPSPAAARATACRRCGVGRRALAAAGPGRRSSRSRAATWPGTCRRTRPWRPRSWPACPYRGRWRSPTAPRPSRTGTTRCWTACRCTSGGAAAFART